MMTSKNYKTCVCGSRSISEQLAFAGLLELERFRHPFLVQASRIVTGMCYGPDIAGLRYARDHRKIPWDEYPANWEAIDSPGAVVRRRRDGTRYNAAAGYERNSKMAEIASCAIAFWDGFSGGTWQCVSEFKKRNKPVVLARFSKERGSFVYHYITAPEK